MQRLRSVYSHSKFQEWLEGKSQWVSQSREWVEQDETEKIGWADTTKDLYSTLVRLALVPGPVFLKVWSQRSLY